MTTIARNASLVTILAAFAVAAACVDFHGPRKDGEPSTGVAKIVFLDRLDGNAAAKAQLDSAWVEVQTAVADWRRVNVERIHIDAEPRQSAKMLEMHSVDSLPGLYFLDEDGELRDFIQGDFTAVQIREILMRQ